jgi:hypothetical protein
MKWIQVYKDHGAVFTWWNTHVNKAMRAVDPLAGKKPRRQLDHAQVYKMLDAGKTRNQIAEIMDFPKENIDYVIKKWRLGQSLDTKHQKPRIDVPALIRDYDSGSTANQLAQQYDTTPAYVYKLIKHKRCQDLSQP